MGERCSTEADESQEYTKDVRDTFETTSLKEKTLNTLVHTLSDSQDCEEQEDKSSQIKTNFDKFWQIITTVHNCPQLFTNVHK